MKIIYDKLFRLLDENNISQKYIKEELKITDSTFQKLRKNGNVNVETIGKFCEYFQVQPNDLLEIVYDEDSLEIERQQKIIELENQLAKLKKK